MKKTTMIFENREIDHSPDHIYYDVLIPYTSEYRLATFSTTFTQPIVDNAFNYKLCVDRIYAPTTSIPIFTFVPNSYIVELGYNGVYSGVVNVPYYSTPNVPTSSPYYYNIYDYDFFLLMVNNALSTAFTSLASKVTLPTGSLAPVIMIDNSTYYLQLKVTEAGYDNTTQSATVIQIFMNIQMFTFFKGLPMFFYSNPTVANHNCLLNVYQTGNNLLTINSVSYIIMTSKIGIESLQEWNSARGIVLGSTKIPISTPEYLPSIGTSTSQVSQLTGQKILSNFDFIQGSSTSSTKVQYLLQSPYKKIDLDNGQPFNQFDIQLYWYDSFNNLTPLFLYYNEAISIRFVLIKKNNCID